MNVATTIDSAASAVPRLSAEPEFASLLGSLFAVITLAGDVTMRLPRPRIEAEGGTPRSQLAPPLKSLAQAVAPEQVLVECGGDGQCGPNVFSYLLGLLGVYEGDGRQLRYDIVQYVRAGRVLDEHTQFRWREPPNDTLTIRDLLLENMRSWPEAVLEGREVSVESWCAITADDHAWTDLTLVQLCATRFAVEVQLIGVNHVGIVEPIMRVRPAGCKRAVGLIFVGCWIGQHFVALVDVKPPLAELRRRGGSQDVEAGREPPTAGAEDNTPNPGASSSGENDPAPLSPHPEDGAPAPPHDPVEVAIREKGGSCVDLNTVAASCVVLLHISMLIQPLVFAHLNGFSVLGAALADQRPKHLAANWVHRLCNALWSTSILSFLVGVSKSGLRLFAAPIDFAPAPTQICRTVEQRKALRTAGVTWAWCTLAALQGTLVAPLAAQAFLATSVFVRAPESLQRAADLGMTGEPVEFQLGRCSARSVVGRPLIDHERGPPADRALAQLLRQDRVLHTLLDVGSAEDGRLLGWKERITPPPLDEIPPELLANLPSFSDVNLRKVAMPDVNVPYLLPWVPLQPAQPLPSEEPPLCPRPRDMLTAKAQRKLQEWLDAQLLDLVHINASLARGVSPSRIDRSRRPKAIAIGQSEMRPWARGLVWDCRLACCTPLDHEQPPSTDLNLEWLRSQLGCFPDQQMLSFALDGVRLQADVELQTVMVPHLVSLSLGFHSVDKEIRRLRDLQWYDFFAELPFLPIYLNGQGAVARKLEPDRFRRSTEGGGPRKPTFDEEGVQARSLNDAAKIHCRPQHWSRDQREVFRQWAATKEKQEGPMRHAAPWAAPHCDIAHPPSHHTPPIWQPSTKWTKERKPTLAILMTALAVLCAAADALHQPIYIFSDDAKDYFNQLGMATPELWKLGIVFVESLDAAPEHARLLFVSEKRLGFGTHGASNTAQRFSDALMRLFADRMDEGEASVGPDEAEPDKWRQWMLDRETVQNDGSPNCHRTRQYASLEEERARGIVVCPQQRLWFATMYTDDPIFVVVGARRAIRALQCWRQLTIDLKLVMAIPEKRVLGSWALWIGALVIAPLGILIIPRHKLMRAATVIQSVLQNGCPFHVYRSLCGLLEHFRAINLRGRNVMHGLYEPHQPDGVSRFGPEATVRCSQLMRQQLQRWLHLIFQSGGVDVRTAVNAELHRPSAPIQVVMDSDACHGDKDPSGVGGFMHGQYWYFPVPTEHYADVDTPMLEFLGVCFNILIFGPQLGHHQGEVVLRTDALTAALTLPKESMRSPALIAAYQHLILTPQWQTLAPRLRIQHIFGDANAIADPVSRARWEEFHTLCAQLGIHPRRIAIDERGDLLELYDEARAKGVRVRRRMPVGAAVRHGREACLLMGSLPCERPAPSPQRLAKIASRTQGAEAPSSSTSLTTQPCVPPGPLPCTALLKLVRIRREPNEVRRCEPAGSEQPLAALPLPVPRAQAGILLPPEMPRAKVNPTLSRINRLAAQRSAEEYLHGSVSMRFNMEPQQLAALSVAIHEGIDYGVNSNTAVKDSRAWIMWEHVCAQHGTDPFRTADEVRDHPQRNAHLLAALMMHAFAIGVPKDPTRQFIKPKSAFAYPLAIIRIFSRWGIHLPSYKQIKASLAHLSRLYIAYHGPYSLAPQRAEPMKYSMVLRMHALSAHQVGRFQWNDSCQPVFMFRRLNLVLWPTGFRLGEIVQHSSGETMYLTFESLTWYIDGVHYTNPSAPQLSALVPGRDYAMLAPPRSKPDQWGEIHCPYPVVLTFYSELGNAASALRDLELDRLAGFSHINRRELPLFHDGCGKPFTHAFLAGMLRDALTHCFGPNVARLYTWHSYRSGLATALHAAGVDDGMIMLICRWMSPESLHVYRRMGTAENERHTRRAMAVNVDLIQTTNVPKVMGDQGYAELFNAYRTLPDPTPPAPECARPVPPPQSNATREPAPARPPCAVPRQAPRPRVCARQTQQARRTKARGRQCRQTRDAGSTTGVGSLDHQFPESLDDYEVYDDRPSKRHAPTPRSRSQWQGVNRDS